MGNRPKTKKISTPLGILLILLAALLVGVLVWRCYLVPEYGVPPIKVSPKPSENEFTIGLDEEVKVIYESGEFLISLKRIDISHRSAEIKIETGDPIRYCVFPEPKRLGGWTPLPNTLGIGEEAFCFTTVECSVRFKLVNVESTKATFESWESCAPPGPEELIFPKEIIINKKIKEVTITTDKTEHELGETVGITIKNNSSVINFIDYPIIENLVNNEWMPIKGGIVWAGCWVTGGLPYLPLEPNILNSYQWDQREKWCSSDLKDLNTYSKEVLSGTYRVKSRMITRTKGEAEDPNNILWQPAETIYSPEFTINGCVINIDDPKGYLFKICKYLRENEDTIIPNKRPNEYSIKEIEEGQYQGRKVLKIWLDYKDLAYIDKETGEVIDFSPGDW